MLKHSAIWFGYNDRSILLITLWPHKAYNFYGQLNKVLKELEANDGA